MSPFRVVFVETNSSQLANECTQENSLQLSAVFTSDTSIRKITKDNYPLEVYKDKAERIEFVFVLS